MQGVEILTSAQVATGYAANWNAFWVASLIIFGLVIVYGFVTTIIDGDLSNLFTFSLLGAIIGFFCGVIVLDVCKIPTKHETQHQVIISDEVSMTEFYEHYKVIDQDGKIFTVREKTNE